MAPPSPSIVLDHVPDRLHDILVALTGVARQLARTIAQGGLGTTLSAAVGENADGDEQRALDVLADKAFMAALVGAGVRYYASEEQEEVLELDPEGRLALAIDPLDGSSNIDVNVSIGTIFSIFEASATGNESFLRPGREQIAAGYVIYGPQTCLVVSFGDGTQKYVLNPDTERFEMANPRVTFPQAASEFAINASNYRHWSRPIRAFIDDCLAGADGVHEADFNMRWVASLVAETHRILTRGGVFLYPADARGNYRRGRLRMVYECMPIAFVVEQAGGRATDGTDPILAMAAIGLHERTPFVFGSADKVDRIAAYHSLPEPEVSALFGHRGLFRA